MANDMINHRNNMFDSMNDWFDFPRNFFNDREVSNIMQSDVSENDKNYTVTVDMPGMNKKDIALSYKDGVLNISGTRTTENDSKDDQGNIIHKERSEGHISRSFRLPNVVANEIHAKYDNGVLTITLPKQAAGDADNSITIE